jgi:hypothetical protein
MLNFLLEGAFVWGPLRLIRRSASQETIKIVLVYVQSLIKLCKGIVNYVPLLSQKLILKLKNSGLGFQV